LAASVQISHRSIFLEWQSTVGVKMGYLTAINDDQCIFEVVWWRAVGWSQRLSFAAVNAKLRSTDKAGFRCLISQ